MSTKANMDRSLFKHTHAIRVRNYEIDWQGIVHNGNYLLYCEVGRVEYLKHIGARVDLNTINGPAKVVLVRNEIDYKQSAVFDEELSVLTRVSFIRNTSFCMESMILNARGETIVENVAYHVWLDPSSSEARRVPDEFRTLVRAFEGEHCTIAKEEAS